MRVFVVLWLVGCSGNHLAPCEAETFSGAVYWMGETAVELDGYEAAPVPVAPEMSFELRWSGPPRRGTVRVRWTPHPESEEDPPGAIQAPPSDLSTAACDPRLGVFRLPFLVTVAPAEITSLDQCIPAVVRTSVPAEDRDSPYGGLESQFAGVLEVCPP